MNTSTRAFALAYQTLSRQQRCVCYSSCASLRSLCSWQPVSDRAQTTEVHSTGFSLQARGFAAWSDELVTAGAPSSCRPSQPSYKADAGASSSDQDTDDDDDVDDDDDHDHEDEDDAEGDEQRGAQQALPSPDIDAATPEAAETEQDELLKTIQSSSKKQQRHMLQQLLTGNELAGDTLGSQEEGMAAIAAAREKYSLKLVDVNSTNKGSPAGGVQSFSAMVVVGDGEGTLGHGTGKAAELVAAIRKASLRALNNVTFVPRYERFTILHPVDTKFGKCKLRMYPLASGGGIRANALLGDIASLAGINSIGIKIHGSRNARNSVKALFKAFEQLTTIEQLAKDKGMAAVELIVGSGPKPRRRFSSAGRRS